MLFGGLFVVPNFIVIGRAVVTLGVTFYWSRCHTELFLAQKQHQIRAKFCENLKSVFIICVSGIGAYQKC